MKRTTSTDLDELSIRARELSGDLQRALADLGARWAEEGRARMRRAVGAPGPEALWATFTVGVLIGLLVGTGLALLAAPRAGSQTRGDLLRRVRGAREAVEARGDGQPVRAGVDES